MATAELAVAILAAFALMIMMCWGIYLVVTQLRCSDVAAAVARQEARGDHAAAARARAVAPPGARVAVTRSRGLVVVTVRLRARPLASWLPAVSLQADAQVMPEPAAP